MALTAKWFVEAAVQDGPSISADGEQHPNTIVYTSVEVAANATETVELLPAGSERVSLLGIKASVESDEVLFAVGDPNDANDPAKLFSLATPVVLLGTGAVALLPGAPLTLWLKNTTADLVTVDILVGRDATP